MKTCNLKLTLLSITLFLSFSNQAFAEADFVHECDEFGAHYDDPGKWATGVYDSDLAPGPTIKHCKNAINKHPNTARFQFQLGRAYYKRGDDKQAFAHLNIARKQGHTAAYAYLADMYNTGRHVKQAPDTALNYYRKAAKGFPPAAQMLAEMEQQQAEHERLSTLNPNLFARGNYIESLYHGNFDDIKNNYDEVLWYTQKMNESFKDKFLYVDPTCVQLADTSFNQFINNEQTKAKTGMTQEEIGATIGNLLSGNRSAIDFDNMASNVGQTFMDLLTNPGRQIRFQKKVDLAQADGDKDAAILVNYYGCSNDIVKQFHINALAFSKNIDPIIRTGVITMKGYEGFRQRCEYHGLAAGSDKPISQATCKCIISAFKQAKLSGDYINDLIDNYPQGISSLKGNEEIQDNLAVCVLRT